jgi:hypothetical protein
MKGVFVVPALVTALLCTGSGQPGSLAASSASAAEVPFKGHFSGTQTVTPLGPQSAFVHGSGTGTATRLGLFTVEFPHEVNFVTRVGDGTYTFTAANGDMLIGDFTGQATGAPPLISIVEHITVTGGTGRFAGATGTITVERTFNQATGVTDASFDGTISAGRAGIP